METLLELGKKHLADKVQNGYLEFYEKHFEPLRDKPLNVLEIGVKREINYPPYSKGACSLKMWKDYFPNANIHGIDVDPMNKNYEEDRIKIFIGNQGDKDFLADVVAEVGHFDIIIDDASHVNTLTIASYEGLFPALSSGGLYVIEDLACSYIDLDAEDVRGKAEKNYYWWGMHLLPDDYSYKNDRKIMADFFEDKITKMDMFRTRYSLQYGDPEVSSLAFYPMMCFMSKI
jgi:hypothetical protein